MRNSSAVAAVAAAANTPLNYLAATTCNGMNYGKKILIKNKNIKRKFYRL